MDWRIGIVPLPVYVMLVALTVAFAMSKEVPGDISLMIAMLVAGAFTCAEIGKRIPVLNKLGGAALVTIFLPSYLVAAGVFPKPMVDTLTDFTKSTKFIYLFIAAVVVGSILAMDRRVMIQGMIRIFVPLTAGSIVGLLVGGTVGWAAGIGFWHAIYYVVVPVMAGGVGEGAIPLSVGYAEVLGQDHGVLLGQILPLVFFGNLVAIVTCGALNTLGKRRPHLTGNGQLRAAGDGIAADTPDANANVSPIDVATVAAGGITAVAVYVLGMLVHELIGLPAPVAMLFLVVAMKLLHAVPPRLQEGTRVVFRFFVTAVTYPLLFATAVAMTPWEELVQAFHWANLVTVVATVTSLVATGYVVGGWMRMFPIDAAIVNGCHSGLGGTGDVMILTAADRMSLMPFAQVATRIGGAITVTVAILTIARVAA